MSRDLLVIPHIKIQNANALSSPFTIGFPAMTAWLGAVHALQRKVNQSGLDVCFEKTGVVCHEFDLQTYQGPGDFVHSIVGTANPLDKTGSRPAFIEEARCHLGVSLVISIPELSGSEQEQLKEIVERSLGGSMKMASGDILSFSPVRITDDFSTLKNRLMPGYAIIERRDLMEEAMATMPDALDALLSFLTVRNHCHQTDNGQVSWQRQRKHGGWLVPVATGFHGISDIGSAKNSRDSDTPHRFAESLVTLGEFKMPYQLEAVEELLWQYQTDLENNLYLCQQTQTEQYF